MIGSAHTVTPDELQSIRSATSSAATSGHRTLAQCTLNYADMWEVRSNALFSMERNTIQQRTWAERKGNVFKWGEEIFLFLLWHPLLCCCCRSAKLQSLTLKRIAPVKDILSSLHSRFLYFYLHLSTFPAFKQVVVLHCTGCTSCLSSRNFNSFHVTPPVYTIVTTGDYELKILINDEVDTFFLSKK